MAQEPEEFVEEDLDSLASDPRAALQAVLYGSDWTVQTIIAQLTNATINLTPRFQRRDAWTITRKSQFIESLLLGMPVPQLIFAEVREAGQFLVLDGKQRLLALMQFFGQSEARNNGFALRGLEVFRDLEGMTHEQLVGNIEYRDIVRRFHNQPIRSAVLRNWPSREYLDLVFVRLNSGSLKLSPQELRQALFPGRFIDYVDDFSIESPGIRRLLNIVGADFRMRDTEMSIRYLGFHMFFSRYQGDLRAFLDSTCETLTREWADHAETVRNLLAQMEQAVDSAFNVFRHAAFRKWTNDRAEARINRAVVDVMLYYLSIPEIRAAAVDSRNEVLSAYQALCNQDLEFRASIEQTTKSVWATHTRFTAFGEMLQQALGIHFPIPQLI